MKDQKKPLTGAERDPKIQEAADSIRWSAPELMDPDRFGYTKGLVAKLPSKSTDLYALGMSILEVSFRVQRCWSSSSDTSALSTGAHRAPAIRPNLGRGCREEGDRRGPSGETQQRVQRWVMEPPTTQLVGGA